MYCNFIFTFSAHVFSWTTKEMKTDPDDLSCSI